MSSDCISSTDRVLRFWTLDSDRSSFGSLTGGLFGYWFFFFTSLPERLLQAGFENTLGLCSSTSSETGHWNPVLTVLWNSGKAPKGELGFVPRERGSRTRPCGVKGSSQPGCDGLWRMWLMKQPPALQREKAKAESRVLFSGKQKGDHCFHPTSTPVSFTLSLSPLFPALICDLPPGSEAQSCSVRQGGVFLL